MELFIVIVIVLAAAWFSIRRFVKMYKEDDACGCGSGCSCSSKHQCSEGEDSKPFKTV